ncbi:ribonuclease HI family protein [Halorubellus sp. JP-L1]|uniref:ribonuclease HI n=1 Tax=Halorubellus sp. JP-L1 TaxID=2715753 RepID=UPI00140B8078|nr:ribonuclease HI [Halorubellus sp. JP-L1]NHN42256.1 ribonuclease HI family protein [Halorubellus sp. JP-L1]
MPVIECDVETAREALADAGATVEPGNTEHERYRATLDDATAVAYDDKLVVQGANPASIEAVVRDESGRAHLYFDGACRGNPGPSAVGWVIVTDDGIVAEGGETVGRATNNQAEYEALVAVLEAARDYGYDEVQVRGDSELIVKQVTGEYGVNDPDLREYRVRVHELLRAFDDWTISHVPREINERADELANEALDDA